MISYQESERIETLDGIESVSAGRFQTIIYFWSKIVRNEENIERIAFWKFSKHLVEQILTIIRIISRTGSTGTHTVNDQTANNKQQQSQIKTHTIECSNVWSCSEFFVFICIDGNVCGWDFSHSLWFGWVCKWEREPSTREEIHHSLTYRSSQFNVQRLSYVCKNSSWQPFDEHTINCFNGEAHSF